MKVLVACEESQAVCIAFRELGIEAWSCDIQECSGGHPEWHIQGDAIAEAYTDKYDLIIGHPPCTYLSNAGNGYFNIVKYGEKAIKRWYDRIEALEFFMKLWNAPAQMICLENPIGFLNGQGLACSQVVEPWYFGDATATPEPQPVYVDKSGKPRYFTDAISGSRGGVSQKLRSKTFPGIAKAMAEQWGNLILQIS